MDTRYWTVQSCSVSRLTRYVSRLGSTVARLKLKGIDGDPHKRWSVWFNSTISEEPYQDLTSLESRRKLRVSSRNQVTGVAWSSSARALRCSVKSVNERNPRRMLYVSCGTAGFTSEEGVDDVRSAWPLCPGRHRRYNGWYKGLRSSNVKPIPKNQSQFGLRSATRPHEVGIASNRESAMSR